MGTNRLSLSSEQKPDVGPSVVPPASLAESITVKRMGSLGKLLRYSALHPVRERAQSIFFSTRCSGSARISSAGACVCGKGRGEQKIVSRM